MGYCQQRDTTNEMNQNKKYIFKDLKLQISKHVEQGREGDDYGN